MSHEPLQVERSHRALGHSRKRCVGGILPQLTLTNHLAGRIDETQEQDADCLRGNYANRQKRSC